MATSPKMAESFVNAGAVVIGRNEGERLKRCFRSLSSIQRLIYVDSGSTDGSAQWAGEHDIEVVLLDRDLPFTAARARNVGLKRLREIAPDLKLVQFVDGDCEIVRGWLESAVTFMDSHPEVAAVSGNLREREPEKSVYNWLCDREWNGPIGRVNECGGIAMMRISALIDVQGFDTGLIAGEEPELCVRLRKAGWQIWRLDRSMALHDAAITRFSQWWKRTIRIGFSYAEAAYLHGSKPERFRVWESRRAWLWGIWLPLGCLTITLMYWPWGAVAWTIFPLQGVRQTARNSGPLGDRITVAFYQLLARFPEAIGQIRFLCNRLFGRRTQLIEYK